MFNSMVLDFAAGLIFTFLAASLATGAIVEAISSLLAVRARTLRKGIGQLLNDPEYKALAKEIYAHAAINPRNDGSDASISAGNRKNPAYIDRQLFGQAMLDEQLAIITTLERGFENRLRVTLADPGPLDKRGHCGAT